MVMLPKPVVFTQYMRPAVSKPKMRPSGAMKLRAKSKLKALVATPVISRKAPAVERISGKSSPPAPPWM